MEVCHHFQRWMAATERHVTEIMERRLVMGLKRKLKRSYFYMFVFPALIIILIAVLVVSIISERYEEQLENISDEAILTAAVQSVIKDFKEVKDQKHPKKEERSYQTMTDYLALSGYSLAIIVNGVEKYNTLTIEDLVIMDKYDDSLYESEDFMTIDNGTASVIKQRFFKGDTEYILYAVNTDYNADAMDLISSIKKTILTVVFMIIFVMIFLIYITNRFLSQKMSKRILTPLELLSRSARQIRDGNLETQISYNSDDEFANVCADFDDMRKRLKKSVDEELASEEIRRELFAGISHDIRSPLTSIKGYAKGLLDGVATTEEKRQEYYTVIYKKACEVDALVDKMFLFTKLDTNKYPFHFSLIRLSEYLDTFVNTFETEYKKNGLELTVSNSCPPEMMLTLDIEEMNRVLTNLLDNSNKYKTGPTAKCSIVCRTDGKWAYLNISDNGPGVPEDALAHLFEAFYRTEKSRKDTYMGSGLGLAISKNIITAHGGSICAINHHGLIVKIKLPIAEGAL